MFHVKHSSVMHNMRAKLYTSIAGRLENGDFFTFDAGQIVTENDLPGTTLANLCRSKQAKEIKEKPARKARARPGIA